MAGLARVAHALAVAVQAIRRAFVFLLGRLTYEPPPWLRALGQRIAAAGRLVRARRPVAVALVGGLVLLSVGGTLGLRWYRSRPKPLTVTVVVTPPGLTPIAERPQPRALVIDFDRSVAPIDRVGKTVATGVTLEPKVDGTWTWATDDRLLFRPRVDWTIGETHTIRLAKRKLLAPHLLLSEYEHRFTTAPFAVELAEAEFHQDPVDPNLKKVVATFGFSHPVDPATFEKAMGMRFVPGDKQDPAKSWPLRVSYDKLKARAFVHSAPLPPPRKTSQLVVKLGKGTRAARGGDAFAQEIEKAVEVPGLYNFVNIARVAVTLVDNERYEPEQILMVEASAGVTAPELTRTLKATLLPETDDKGKRPSWHDPDAVTPQDLARGQALSLAAVASEKEHDVLHSFRFNATVGRRIYVRIDKGMRAFGGYILGETVQRIVEVPPYPRRLKLLHEGAMLALSGDRKVSVFVRDVPGIRFEVGRVLPAQLHHLVSQSHGAFSAPNFYRGIDQDNLTEVSREERALDAALPGKPRYEALDLSKHLGDGERRGLFFVRAESWDPKNKRLLGEQDSRFVLVSDLGILAKRNGDGSHDVFVQSIASGRPVGGAKVEVLGKNGLPVVGETTGEDGHVHLPALDQLQREKTPVVFLVTSGRDQSFLPFGRSDRLLDNTRFDVGGVSEEGPTQGLTAFVFSDRGLYRPGDEIRVGFVVKSRDWAPRLAGLPLEVVVTDPRGLTVRRQRMKLGAAGFEEIRHAVAEVAPTGTYAFNLHIVKDDRTGTLLGSTTVAVREFLPDRMKIRVALSAESPEGWIPPGDLSAKVTLTTLHGTPANARRVRAKMTLVPWAPSFGKLRDYHFFDPMNAREAHEEALPAASTDDDGHAELPLDLKRFAPATYRLTVLAEGFEAEGGRSVTAEASSVVSPLPYLIGWKPDGPLSYVNRGADRSVDLVAIDPGGRRTKVDGLQAVLLEHKYVSVLARQDNGTYRYQSVRKEVELSRKPLAITAQGRKLKLPTDKAGDFAFSIRGNGDRELQNIGFAVSGFGNLSREVEKNAELKLALKQQDVEPGRDVELQIKAPFTGSGLITVERDRVYAWKWFRTETTATVQTIRVPPEMEGGGYVSVSFIRDPASPEVFMSPLGYGVMPLSVSRARRTVQIKLDAPELAKPGQPFKMRLRTDRPSRVVLFAVDEGILRVARYATPDPLAFFFQKRALAVRTSQILDMILPEFQRLLQAAAPGGDAEDAALGANLNPFRRKQAKPVAYWSGILDAGPDTKEVIYEVPDHFNGTLRVMAVAVAPDAVGALDTRSVVRGDFVIAPNVPTFLAPGDETEISVSVTNAVVGSGKGARVGLELQTTPALEILGDRKRTLAIDELAEGSTTFKVRARPPLGSARLSFSASASGKTTRLSTETSVRPAAAYMTTFSAGTIRDKEATVPVTRQLYAEHRKLVAGLSYVPLGLAHGLVGYLEKFPHGCTEQIVSQAVPALVLGKHPEFGLPPDVSAVAVDAWIQTLRGRQNEDGGFGRWAVNPAVDVQASIWAAHMLLEARERGFSVPADMRKSALAYVQTVAERDGDDLSEERRRAYATYVLTLSGINTARLLAAQLKFIEANHKGWRTDLAGLYLAAVHRLLRQEAPARAIAADMPKLGTACTPHFASYYDQLGRDAQALYLLARHFPELAARLDAAQITALADPIFNGRYNTFSSAWSVLALETYARVATREAPGKLSASEIVAGKPAPLDLTKGLLPMAAFSGRATALRFANDGPFDAYYVVGEHGFDATLPAKPMARKLEVFREYLDTAGKPIAVVKLGDEIRVRVRLRALGEATDSVAIVDLLPGGFEPVVQGAASRQGEEGSGQEGGAEAQHGEGEAEGEGEETPDPPQDHGAGTGSPVNRAQGFALPIALGGTTFAPEYGDVREDRIVLYGAAVPQMREYLYAIKATNAGTYAIAPIMGDALYDRSVVARGMAGTITVTRP